ncbi:hypothetical protein AB0C87_24785 [Actinomadura sp. NPDC048021]|uniref:hypothetical protein n=1 Tax=Actinomadura sp. NPDC048021 TaxID=3155385 RepID=UPI00340C0C3A
MLDAINNRIFPGALLLQVDLGEGWWNRVDLTRLDSSSDTNSVLGQLFGSKAVGLALLGLSASEADSLGFHVDTESYAGFKEMPEAEALAYGVLDLGWTNLIAGLQQEIPAASF